VTYGLTMQWAFTAPQMEGLARVMTISFLFGVPITGGLLAVLLAERWQRLSWVARIFLPWASVLTLFVAAITVGFTAMICFIFALPLFLALASIGGLIGGLLADRWRGRRATTPVLALGLLPLLTVSFEAHLPTPTLVRTVETEVVVAAEADAVWRQIVRVSPIAAEEPGFAFSTLIGIPRPVEATVDSLGVGGRRHGIFEKGLRFDETITTWEPGRRLAFSIEADTSAIQKGPSYDLRLIGSRYFDVEQAEYRLEPLPDGRTRLRLSSRYRLGTHFNPYAQLWTDTVMRDFQKGVLTIVKARAERP
jgi:hypothetical protein